MPALLQLLGFPTPVVVPAATAVDASSEGAVAPASKKARQYDLPPQQPLQPMPHLQPPLPASSSSPAALPEPDTTSSPTEPETKKHKLQHEEDDDTQPMDSFHPLQPTDPPVLPLAEHQPVTTADLDASRSRSRTHTVKFRRLLPFHIKTKVMIRHVRLDKRKLAFPNILCLHQIRHRGLLPWRQLSSTPTLPRHMDEYMLNWVMSRTLSSGRIWASTILCSGWTTLKRRPPTTHLT